MSENVNRRDNRISKAELNHLDLGQKLTFSELVSTMLDISVPTNIRTKITNVKPFDSNKDLMVLDFDVFLKAKDKQKVINTFKDDYQKTISCNFNPLDLDQNTSAYVELLLKNGFYFTFDAKGNTDFNVTKTLVDEFNTINGYACIFTNDDRLKVCECEECEVFSTKRLKPTVLNVSQIRECNLINTKEFYKIMYWLNRVRDKGMNPYDLTTIKEIYPNAKEEDLKNINKKIKFWVK